MLLALDWGLALHSRDMVALFFYSGLVLHTGLFLAIMYVLERHPGVKVAAVSPGWYMPAVGNVLVPYVGGVAASMGLPAPRPLMAIYLGTGVVMWIVLLTIWLYRAIFYSPPPGRMVATLWINLAPPAVIPLSYEALLGIGPRGLHALALRSPVLGAAAMLVYKLIYYTFWGSAGLLFALVAVITLGYAARREIEFADSWWAFVFPLAAYAISTIHGYFVLHAGWLLSYSAMLYALAWLTYTVTTVLSLRAAWRRAERAS
jgi:tellurite resistance protein